MRVLVDVPKILLGVCYIGLEKIVVGLAKAFLSSRATGVLANWLRMAAKT